MKPAGLQISPVEIFVLLIIATSAFCQNTPQGEPSDAEKEALARTFTPPIAVEIERDTQSAWEKIAIKANTKVLVTWMGWDRKWVKASVVGEDTTKLHMIPTTALRARIEPDGTPVAFEAPGPVLSRILTDPSLWKKENLPATSVTASQGANREIQEYQNVGNLLGLTARTVQAHMVNGEIQHFEILWLEAGFFFSKAKSGEVEAKIQKAQSEKDANEVRRLERELAKVRVAELEENRKNFKAAFSDLEVQIPPALESALHTTGQKVRVGMGQMALTPIEHDNKLVAARTLFDPTQLISTTITRSVDLSRRMVGNIAGRRSDVRNNVIKAPNGDVYLENVPSSNQGPRGYCMFGTLAMVLQYFGANTTMEQLQSRFPAEFMKGDQGIRGDLYLAAAKECKLRIEFSPTLSFAEIQRKIDQGIPIIVWRCFSGDRQALHNTWRDEVAKDYNFKIDDPRQAKEKGKWPLMGNADTGYHASVITGYSRQRGEVLFTESWGNLARNSRMSKEEMAATGYRYTVFFP